MGAFNLEDYATVQDRISEFFQDFPDGSIQTFLNRMEGPEVVFEARVFRSPEEVTSGVFTSGWAHEVEGRSPVNKTSFLENCESSSIGRALANMAYSKDARRPSRSEMLKVARMRQEHDAMLEWIRGVGASCEEEQEIKIGNASRNLKAYVRENWQGLKEQYRLARALVEAIESATGQTFTP